MLDMTNFLLFQVELLKLQLNFLVLVVQLRIQVEEMDPILKADMYMVI